MIAAIVLGMLAISALGFAFLPGMFSGGTKVNASVTVSPKPASIRSIAGSR